jgi:L-alanine-DL-glutamate epimerase-like enolase superfamily enzyme
MTGKKAIIKRLEIYKLDKVAFGQASSLESDRHTIVIRTASRTEDGIVEGWGSCNADESSISGQTTGIITEDLEMRIAPNILEKEIESTESVLDLINSISPLRKNMDAAITAIDAALFDTVGKIENQPVCFLIRKLKDLVPVKSQNIHLPESAVKIQALWGNERFRNTEEVIKHLDSLSYQPGLIIQPFDREALHLSLQLKNQLAERSSSTLLILDPFYFSTGKISSIIQLKAADGILFRPENLGGFTSLVELMKILEKHPDFKLVINIEHSPGIASVLNFNIAALLHDTRFSFFLTGEKNLGEIEGNIREIAGIPGNGYSPVFEKIESSALSASVIYCRNNRITVRKFPYRNGKPDFRNVKEEIL